MSHRECDQLEAYLARGLGLDEAAAFAGHLPRCPACRHEVEEQTRIDRLLREAVGRLDPLPAGLLAKVEGRIARHRRRRLAWAGGLCAAALVLLAIDSWVARPNARPDGDSPTIAQKDPDSTMKKSPGSLPLRRPRAEVVMAYPDAAIIVPFKSKSPNVTIVWIYPTVRPAEGASGPDSD